ncbi:---NA---, partial [Paramuricea clavata]
YSVSGSISGIYQNSTAFFGCDKKKCCGCFGPAGGTDDYCGTYCKKRRNGTVTKNVYSWFWVRSSIPKKVWNKCMDYKVTTPSGDTVRYKLLDGNPTPEKVNIRLVAA